MFLQENNVGIESISLNEVMDTIHRQFPFGSDIGKFKLASKRNVSGEQCQRVINSINGTALGIPGASSVLKSSNINKTFVDGAFKSLPKKFNGTNVTIFQNIVEIHTKESFQNFDDIGKCVNMVQSSLLMNKDFQTHGGKDVEFYTARSGGINVGLWFKDGNGDATMVASLIFPPNITDPIRIVLSVFGK